jgi:hypothetical protein
MAMTVYLWHLTALLGVVEAEHLLGITRGTVGDAAFWPVTVVHLAVALAAVALLVAFVVPFEHLPVPWFEHPREREDSHAAWTAVTAAGVVACGTGLLVLSATGMEGFPSGHFTDYAGLRLSPALGLAILAGGAVLARAGGSRLRPAAPGPAERVEALR